MLNVKKWHFMTRYSMIAKSLKLQN